MKIDAIGYGPWSGKCCENYPTKQTITKKIGWGHSVHTAKKPKS